VICLQEVCSEFAGGLHPFFAKRGYQFLTAAYGTRFNGYMGVGVAVPSSLFSIEDVDVVCIGETLGYNTSQERNNKNKEIPDLNDLNAVQRSLRWISTPVRKLSSILRPERANSSETREPFDPFRASAFKHNHMISVRLKDRSKPENLPFCVSTYHMPCSFRKPQVMTIHAALSAQHAERFAGENAYILGGDFNITPQSSMYALLTQGSMETKHPDYPTLEIESAGLSSTSDGNNLLHGLLRSKFLKTSNSARAQKAGDTDSSHSFAPDEKTQFLFDPTVTPMRSAYKESLGTEPDFTNWAQVRDQEPFIDTLDYIFLSQHWKVCSVEDVPRRLEVQGPFPIKERPSDHILISATLHLENEEQRK
jgi:endonuclease/exonuclease/phosphatase family metal-dependent hydrolase